MTRIEIPVKLPSLNEYTSACRSNSAIGATLKRRTQKEIAPFISELPKFTTPIFVHFHWVDGNNQRDYDNIAFAKKFILDCMVNLGKLNDDNRKCVIGFSDTFEVEKGVYKVVLEISEVAE